MAAAQLRGRLAQPCAQDDCRPSTSGRGVPLPVHVAPSRSWRGRRLAVAAAGPGVGGVPQMFAENPLPLRSQPVQGVVRGARTTPTPRLTPERVLQRLAESTHPVAQQHWGAFYSSELGGIVTEPAFMVVHMDDLLVHRGYAVAEALWLVDGYLYQLDEHIARFKDSAALAGIPLPVPEERLRRILLDTAAASMKMTGMLRFWLSRGRGGFGATGADPQEPCLYALLTTEATYAQPERDDGWRAVTTPLEAPSLYFAAMRNASQIATAVAQAEAEARGADMAVFVDADGTVLFGADCSIGLLSQEDVLVLPPDEAGLAGMAVNNLAELTMQYVDAEDEPFLTVSGVERRTFKVEELLASKEAFAISSELGVVGIAFYDDAYVGGHEYGDQSGPVSLALNSVLEVARKPVKGQGGPHHTEVPYGYLTGMAAQLQ